MNGFIEFSIAATVFLTSLRLAILIAHLNKLKSVRFLMAIGDAAAAPFGSLISIGIFDGIQGILHQGIYLFKRNGKAMSQTYIDHKHWSSIQIFTHLQVFIITQTIRRAVMPVMVPMSRTFLYGTERILPLEGIFQCTLSFHVTTARETEEGRFGIMKKLGKVRAQTILATFPGIRHE